MHGGVYQELSRGHLDSEYFVWTPRHGRKVYPCSRCICTCIDTIRTHLPRIYNWYCFHKPSRLEDTAQFLSGHHNISQRSSPTSTSRALFLKTSRCLLNQFFLDNQSSLFFRKLILSFSNTRLWHYRIVICIIFARGKYWTAIFFTIKLKTSASWLANIPNRASGTSGIVQNRISNQWSNIAESG